METPDTTPVQGDGGDMDMADEPVFKVPNKRKKQGKGQGKKQARKETKVEEGESDSDDRISDSVLTFDSQEEQINYTLNVTRDIVRSLKALEMEIVELQRLKATGDRGHIEALKSKKAKMNDLLDITAQGALVRSRFKSAAEMDAPKFFFSLEQKNGQKRFIHAVRTESGDLLSEPTEIRKQTVSFYSKLYSSEWSGEQVVEDSFLVGLPKLSERAARELDRELSLEELHEALQRMENGRASRIDGLPAEFYKAFWAVIGQDVLDVLWDSIRRDQEKAFDRVEHEYLWKVLEAFGFNSGFVAMIRVFYCEIESVQKYTGCWRSLWYTGGRLDISGVTVPALSRTLVSSGIVTLRELMNVAGSDLSRAEDLAARMGLRSLRVVNQLLHRWRSALTSEERVQLMDCQRTETGPAENKPFPQLNIAPDLDGCAGPLLECQSEGEMDFRSVSGKLLYRACIKVLNKKKLSGRVDTPWRSVLGFNGDINPEWTH
ncbi:hypothetical protein QTP86_013881, partial [Hemibagrus guttatus]